MNNFQLSSEVDSNKVFLVKRSELEERLDSHFYKPFFRRNEQKIEQVNHGKLSNLVEFSSEAWNQKSIFFDTFPYIEIGEINLLTGEISKINHIKIEDAPSRAKMIIHSNDILVSTTRPNRGAISQIKADGIFIASTGFSVVRKIRVPNINRSFLFYWLRSSPSLWQMEQRSSGGNYPAITQEELAKIKIPIPPKEIQSQIVAKMDDAYNSKKQKEAQAQRLLDGIDDYLLGQLGIELPKQAENTIQSRMFTRQLSEVSGGRFDPIYYSSDLRIFLNGKYTSSKISEFSIKIISGVGAGRQDQTREDDGIIQIRPTNIDANGELQYDKNVFLPSNSQFEKIDIDDVLFNNTNSQVLVGKTSILKESKELFFSNHITKITVNTSKVLPDYLVSILNSYRRHNVFYSICTNWNNQSGVGLDLLKSLKVPLPPIEKQTEIADHISNIRNQAKVLQQQAKAGLEQAKKEVEAMILGGED